MGQYVSPFAQPSQSGGSAPVPKAKSTNYISPFEGSRYTEDYWKKRKQEDDVAKGVKPAGTPFLIQSPAEQQKTKDKQKSEVVAFGKVRDNQAVLTPQEFKDSLAKNKAADKAINANPYSIGNIARGAYDAVVKPTVDTAVNAYKQAQFSPQIKNVNANDKLIETKSKWLDDDVKAGKISQADANKEKERLKGLGQVRTESIKKAEEKIGTKYDPNQGAIDFLSTATDAAGLEGIAKVLFTKAAKVASERLGRDLTKEEATNLATKTKETLPTKPQTEVPLTRQSEAGFVSAPPLESPVVQESKAVKSFAPLDEPTVAKVTDLKAKADAVPVPEGHTRLFQTNDKSAAGIQSDQYFKNPDELSNYINGRADNAELRYVDVPDSQVASVPGKPTVFKVADDTVNPVEPLKPVGDTTSGNASRIESLALEKKLTDKMGDLPQYKSINMKEQAQEATKLISENKQHAIDVIEGRANPPGNLKSQSVHQALEDLAIKEGDGALLTKLAKSHVNTELSESAQNLRIAAERDPHSAVEQIRQIQDARLKAAEKRSKTTVKKEASAINKAVEATMKKTTKQDWDSFITELAC